MLLVAAGAVVLACGQTDTVIVDVSGNPDTLLLTAEVDTAVVTRADTTFGPADTVVITQFDTVFTPADTVVLTSFDTVFSPPDTVIVNTVDTVVSGTDTTLTVCKGRHIGGLVALHGFVCGGDRTQFMQVKLRELFMHDIPGLGVQLPTFGWVSDAFGLLNQFIVALVVPPVSYPTVSTLGVQIAVEEAIRIETVAIALDVGMEIASG